MREDLREIVSSVCRHSGRLRSIHFATNGTFEDRILAMTEHLGRIRPGLQIVVTISIDGPRDLHDTIRGRSGTWDKAVATFRQLKRTANVKAQVGFTLSHATWGALKKPFALSRTRGRS